MKKYKTVISGGTFDHFHKGHEVFLRSQFALAQTVLIGITSDFYVSAQKEPGIESFTKRQESVRSFLQKEGVLDRMELTPISDGGIPQIWKKRTIDAIIATNDTRKGAQVINLQREKEGLSPLPIEIIPDVLADDKKLLSSTRIRHGEIDRSGQTWVNKRYGEKPLVLPDFLRPTIQKPFDTVYPDIDAWIKHTRVYAEQVIAVGDVVTESLLSRRWNPKGVVVDLFVERERKYQSLEEHTFTGDEVLFFVKNPKGTIQSEIFTVVQKSLQTQKRFVVSVEGEEDLLVLPYILMAPLGWVILYGQPWKGIVAVSVTEEKKNEAKKILQTFNF